MGKHAGILNASSTQAVSAYTGGGFASYSVGKVFMTPMTSVTSTTMNSGVVSYTSVTVNEESIHNMGCGLCLHVYVGGKTYDYPASTTSVSSFNDNDNYTSRTVAGAFNIRANNKTGYLFGSTYLYSLTGQASAITCPISITNRIYAVHVSMSISTAAVTRFTQSYYQSTITSASPPASWPAKGTSSTTVLQIHNSTTAYYTNSNISFSNTISRYAASNFSSSRSSIFESGSQTYQTTVVTCNVTSQEAGWTHSQGNFAWSSSSNTAWLTARRSGRDARITTSMKRTFTHSFYSNQNNIYSNHNSYISGSGSVNIKQFTTSHTKGSYSSKQYDTPAVNASSATTASKAVNASSSTYGSTQTNTRYVSYSLKTKSINSGYASSSNNRTTETIWSSRQTTRQTGNTGSYLKTMSYGNVLTCKSYYSFASYPATSRYTARIYYHNFVT